MGPAWTINKVSLKVAAAGNIIFAVSKLVCGKKRLYFIFHVKSSDDDEFSFDETI